MRWRTLTHPRVGDEGGASRVDMYLKGHVRYVNVPELPVLLEDTRLRYRLCSRMVRIRERRLRNGQGDSVAGAGHLRRRGCWLRVEVNRQLNGGRADNDESARGIRLFV